MKRLDPETFRNVLEATSDVVWDWDIVGGTINYSDGYARILGIDGQPSVTPYDEWRTRVHPDDVGLIDLRMSEYLQHGGRFVVQYRIRRADGEWCSVLSRGTIVERNSQGLATRMIGTHQDVTAVTRVEQERSRLREQLEQTHKLESIGRLSGGIAHDFNNLLTVINGNSDLLLVTMPEDGPHRELVFDIRNAGQQAARLTHQLLAFSRRQMLQPEMLLVDALVTDVARMLGRLVGEDVKLRLDLNAPADPVFVDPGQLEQVLLNLVVNARDAMPRGGEVTIRTEKREGHLVLSVRDTGVGMDAATRARLFEPFFTTKPVGRGTGLGLSVVHGIVTQSNGHIEVHSEPGSGSEFRVFLPLVDRPPILSQPDGLAEEHATPLGSETVLVIEEEAGVRAFVASALERYGYQAIATDSMQAAIDLFQQRGGAVDLVLSDVVMADGNGALLAQSLRLIRPDARLLFMSGSAAGVIALNDLFDGAVPLIQKPFSPEHLVRRVRETLGRAEPSTVCLLNLDDSSRDAFSRPLQAAGYLVLEASSPSELRRTRVNAVIAHLPTDVRLATRVVAQIRRAVPSCAVIGVTEATGARFLDLGRVRDLEAVVAEPITPAFLVRSVRRAMQARAPGGKP